jgi:hypothetical protein
MSINEPEGIDFNAWKQNLIVVIAGDGFLLDFLFPGYLSNDITNR